jgi:hypothetical protein
MNYRLGLPYYHVLWVSKYQRVSKRSLLRDRRSTLADPCLDISPIHYRIVDRQRNKKNFIVAALRDNVCSTRIRFQSPPLS